MQKEQYVVKTWDKDIYFIDGSNFESPGDAFDKIRAQDTFTPPTGSKFDTSVVKGVQRYEDYKWQAIAKSNHKRGEYLKHGEWHNSNGATGRKANVKLISGELNERLLEMKKQDKLEDGLQD